MHPFQKLRSIYQEYPPQFWLLIVAAFIDRLGGALLFPFFSLYITARFGVTLTQVGVVMAIFGLTGFVGSFAGGALTDMIGRKQVIIVGLSLSALSGLALGLAGSMSVLYGLAFFAGLFADFGHPARQSMLADILPEHQHADGYAVQRIANNVAVAVGPIIGGFIASRSYLALFVLDALTSLTMALIIAFAMRETYIPQPTEGDDPAPSFRQTLLSYGTILATNALFTVFLLVVTLQNFAYDQMYTTMPVFLRDARGLPPSSYGYLLSMNALIVVFFQFAVTRRVKGIPPLLVMMAASLVYALGFSMYGVVYRFPLFAAGMILITLAEMMILPTARAFVTRIAPQDQRGRFMALFGLSWILPSSFATLPAGLIIGAFGFNAVWFVAGGVSLVAAVGFTLLHTRVSSTLTAPPTPAR